MNRVITIIRKPTELRAIINRPKYEFVPSVDGNTVEGLKDFYHPMECLLESLEVELSERHKQLIDSWNSLCNIRTWETQTLFHILVVLIETAPVFSPESSQLKLPELIIRHQPTVEATAAHPRAYKGTKYKPPKIKGIPETDLRPYLCDRNRIPQILQALSPYWVPAIDKLAKAGYTVNPFSSETQENLYPILNPYFAFHHSLYADVTQYKLPMEFIQYLLPSLQGLPWQNVLDMLSLYWGLSLHSNKALLHGISRLLNLDHNKNTLKWCHIITRLSQERREIFTTLLIELKAYLLDINNLAFSDFERFETLTPDAYYEKRAFVFLSALKKQIPVVYLFTGFQLANTYEEDYKFRHIDKHCSAFPYQTIEQIIEHVKDAEDYYNTFTLALWEKCGELKGFDTILTRIHWKELPPDAAFHYLKLYMYFCDWTLSPEVVRKKWNFLKHQIDHIESLLWKVEKEYQEKFVRQLRDYYWYWDNIDELQEYIPITYKITQRLAQPPFQKTASKASEMISCFIDRVDSSLREIFLNAPDSSFSNLEKACRSENRTRLLAKGITAMMKEIPQFTINSFLHFSKRLNNVAKLLGTLRPPLCYFVLKQFENHQIMNDDLETLPVEKCYLLFKKFCDAHVTNPIPKKLQEYVQGHYTLSEARIQRYTAKMRHNLSATRLDTLEQLILQTLQENYPLNQKQKNWSHTLQFMSVLDGNRRPFKRFLKAYIDGNTHYVRAHHETQAWLRKHPHIDITLWTTGIDYFKESKKYRTIWIQMEQDPLEALKMGTYVGSCLGIGGICAYSAAAVVLDINKQILYARNKNNVVIARQLIAFSEEKKLVCFEVYPSGVDTEILEMFREYDIRFAEALGIEVYHGKNDEEYTIEHILSQEWWDDFPWDLTI